jgi:uncharacterized protein
MGPDAGVALVFNNRFPLNYVYSTPRLISKQYPLKGVLWGSILFLLTLYPKWVIIPVMGISKNNKLSSFLFSKTRRKLLTLFYNHPDESFYVTQILGLLGAGSGAAQRELKTMTEAEIITRQQSGRLVYYRANDKSPVYEELRNIVLKIHPETYSLEDAEHNAISSRFGISRRKLASFCRRRHIKKLSLFGSILREDFSAQSDIDVLVEFEAGHVPGFNIVNIENELSQLLERKVDLRTPADLSRYFRDQVVREARVEYEHA